MHTIVPGHGDLTLTANRKKIVLFLFGSLCIVAFGMWMGSGKPLPGWSCFSLFRLDVPTSFFMLLPGAMYLKLDAEGFELASFRNAKPSGWCNCVHRPIQVIAG